MSQSRIPRKSAYLADRLVALGEILHQVSAEKFIQQTRSLSGSASAEDECGGSEVLDDLDFFAGDVEGEIGPVLILKDTV